MITDFTFDITGTVSGNVDVFADAQNRGLALGNYGFTESVTGHEKKYFTYYNLSATRGNDEGTIRATYTLNFAKYLHGYNAENLYVKAGIYTTVKGQSYGSGTIKVTFSDNTTTSKTVNRVANIGGWSDQEITIPLKENCKVKNLQIYLTAFDNSYYASCGIRATQIILKDVVTVSSITVR